MGNKTPTHVSETTAPLTPERIAEIKQAAWAWKCRRYAVTYEPNDPQRAEWLRRAEAKQR